MLPNDPSPLGSRVSPKTERGARGWLENSFTPKKHVFFFYCVGGVGWGGGGVVWGVLPFGTLNYVGTIFFKFLVL